MSSALNRFINSMNIDYEKWHDGVGYDLEAIDEMNESDKASVRKTLLARGVQDWRDLEAMERVGGADFDSAIREARKMPERWLALEAHRYGPPPTSEEMDDVLVEELGSKDVVAVSKAIKMAADHGTERVRAALLELVRRAGPPSGYSAAATLFYLHGKMDSPDGFENRKLFLNFSEPLSETRTAAFQEFCKRLKITPPPGM